MSAWALVADIGGTNARFALTDLAAPNVELHEAQSLRNADFASSTRKTIGSVYSSLLMTHQHMLNAVLLVQRVVNIENCPAWVTPQVLDTFSLKRLDEDFGAH